MSKLGIDILLHEQRLAHLPLAPSSGATCAAHLERAGTLSCAWSGPPTREALLTWLSNILPENGREAAWRERSQRRLENHGGDPFLLGPAHLIWGNSDAEYPGALSFASCGQDGAPLPPFAAPPELLAVDDEQIGNMLLQAIMEVRRSGPRRLATGPVNAVSLSGVRPKIGLALIKGQWLAPMGGHTSTHIVKVEDDQNVLPGEALLESICQRALSYAGLPAADTHARVFGNVQAVVSKRSDRAADPRTGRIVRLHQEEWAQAACIRPSDKYDTLAGRPHWGDLAELLHTCASDPTREITALLRLLAAAVLLGHCDLHRKNIGLLHTDESIVLAPAYDVSSIAGAKGFSGRLAVGVMGQNDHVRVHWGHWRRLAAQCGLPLEQADAAVLGVAKALPDAFSEAWRASSSEDEARVDVRQAGERRLNETSRRVKARIHTLLAHKDAPELPDKSAASSPGTAFDCDKKR